MQTVADMHAPDARQREVSENFTAYAALASVYADARFDGDSHNRICEPARAELARQSRQHIQLLSDRLHVISGEVTSLSTAHGTVHPEQSAEYLDQEIMLRRHREALEAWRQAYSRHRDAISRITRDEREPFFPENALLHTALDELEKPLSSLDDEESLRRACLVLGEVDRRRRSLRYLFWAAPVNSVSSTAFTVASSVALAAHWAGGIIGLGTTACHYGAEFMRARHAQNSLLPSEQSALSTIVKHLENDRGMISMYLAEGGIMDAPETVAARFRKTD